MSGYTHVEGLSSEGVQRLRSVYEPLAGSVRALIDATIRSEVDADEVAAVRAQIDDATARLRAEQIDGPFGVRITSDGDRMPWGNPAIGIRNPMAPPLVIIKDGDGAVRTDFHLGAAYEGPPGHVHGGMVAMVLDHVLGEVAASDPDSPRFTGTLTIRYLRATPLGDLHAEGRITRTDGIKAFAAGHVSDADGITAEAEGVFILPKWARG
ncbi:acyl-coenzyme A thioesterase PaaI-like protein [Mycobacterium frederiksbergense]|uniref:Acyl-coenzyme A thioesterase THEM4 n=1 Tax=Mycolicibacterium frederiksbergense TaxID=117567 RepID=A0ABT6KU61_9MYCO|nr:PaaI family thioesterase [Mycolicibacterium frederiksbergense]MDH6194259.1 acyl-coenzyme A thioesterase PaaI-like protein [Mycolicibacterium frederiksbergense]